MMFSKKLAGALVAAAALAFAPAAGAAPAGPGNGITAQTSPVPGSTSPTTSMDRAICLYWYHAAEAANDDYWLSVDFPDVEWETPDGDDDDLDHVHDLDDEYNAAWSAFSAAVQEYERRNCDDVLGRPAPEWERR